MKTAMMKTATINAATLQAAPTGLRRYMLASALAMLLAAVVVSSEALA